MLLPLSHLFTNKIVKECAAWGWEMGLKRNIPVVTACLCLKVHNLVFFSRELTTFIVTEISFKSVSSQLVVHMQWYETINTSDSSQSYILSVTV